MTAPIAGHARVSAQGDVIALGPKPAPDAAVRPDDVADSTKLAKVIEGLLATVAMLKARWYPRKLDYEGIVTGQAGATSRVAHGLAGAVRWSVVGWQTNATPTTDNQLCHATTWMMRALWGGLTIASTAGNFTVGARFRATSPCLITGARFLWKAATKTVKVTLWRDSDGLILGVGTTSCSDSGVYSVQFAAPVFLDGANLNVDMTLGVRDVAGTVFTNTGTDAVWQGYLPITLPGFSLRTNQLFIAGDARPTTTAGGGLNWVEPVLAPVSPQLVENSATTNDSLVLTSYVPGTATIRVEAAG